MAQKSITVYLKNLIEEKGRSVDDSVIIDGHFGITWQHLIDFVDQMPQDITDPIRYNLIEIDFKNGNVFDYLQYLAESMAKTKEKLIFG